MKLSNHILPLSLLACLGMACPAPAQDDEIAELKAALKAMQQIVEQQNSRIAALERQVAPSKPAAASPGSAVANPASASATASSSASPPTMVDPSHTVRVAAMDIPVGQLPAGAAPAGQSLVRDMDAFVDQQQAVPRANNVPLDPTLMGFIPIPGTESMFKIGGSARIDAITDFGNSGNPNQFVPSSIPMPGEAGAFSGHRSTLHTKASRLSLELRRPVPGDSTLRIYSEFDFFGNSTSTGMDFRARHFYGQAWNLLIGQTFSAFMDGDAFPDVVDYETPNAILNRRVPQLRYTQPLSDGPVKTMAFFSIEQPDARIDVSAADAPAGSAGVNRIPDGVAGFRIEGEAGHIQTSALLRQLSYDSDAGGRDDTFGWGANFSGVLNVLEKDKLILQATYGEGVSRYVNDLSGLNLDAAYVNGGLESIPVMAVMAGYTHQWSEHWRSTVTGGYVDVSAPSSIGGGAIESTLYSSVNLMWHPTKSFRVGLEYLFGMKETADGAEADAHRINLVLRYDLVR